VATKSEDDAKKSHEDLLETARKRFDLAEEAWRESKKLALEDMQFLAGDQWPEAIRKERESDGRPTLTINRLHQHVKQVTNDGRQNRPSIKVYPVDDNADVETAKILQGLIKHIETNSGADVAYDRGLDCAVKGGFGFWRVVTDYCDPLSFDQEALIKSIRDPLSVTFDPHSTEPDGSDANFAFITDDIPHEEYKATYPDSDLSKHSDWSRLQHEVPGWMSDSTCRIAEYFYKDFKEVELVLLSDGQVYDAADLAAGLPIGPEGLPLEVVQKRVSKIPIIKWAKINAVEVLEETEWPGRWIPIVPVYGDEVVLGGKRVLEGIVRHGKDPARIYNFNVSAEVEAISLAPKAPFVGMEGQFEGYEHQWATANRKNYAFLQYKAKTLANGQPAPPPQRMSTEANTMAITNSRMQSADDIKATTGIHDASLGARSNESSGIAIQRRNQQAQTANFHFIDNQTRSMRHTGRILVDIIPKIYDTARAVRIIGEEGDQQVVQVNAVVDGQETYNLGAGKYDVVCEVGPSYATKRQEAVQTMLDLTKAYPQLMQIAGDLWLKQMDIPGAKEIAERVKKTLPPGLAEDDEKNKKPIPPEVQAQIQQMSQMIEQLTAAANESSEALKTKKLELESRERIEFKKLEVQVELKRAELDQAASLAVLEGEIAELRHRQELVQMSQPIDSDSTGQMPDQPMPDEQQQLTGELSPGLPMEQ
jgi:hypothetical protein